MKPFGVELLDLSVRYGNLTAVDRLSLSIAPGTITGLLGRNGSGKTSLLSVVASFRQASGGRVLVDGEDPFENPRVAAGTCLIRENGDFGTDSVADILLLSSRARASWSHEVAEALLARFKLPTKRGVEALSRGQRSALGALVGLASRAPLTLFDEVYLGMDAPTRYAFYDALLTDYLAHPRTIVLSSHLIEEVERLFEQVVVIDAGRLVLNEPAEELRARGVSVTGPSENVERFVAPYTVLRRRQLGRTTQATVYGRLGEHAGSDAAAAGLELGHITIQDLFVHLTEQEAAGAAKELK